MSNFSIGKVADILHIKTHTIRYWTDTLPHIKCNIGKGNRRYFDNFALEELKKVKELIKYYGITMDGIKNLSNFLKRMIFYISIATGIMNILILIASFYSVYLVEILIKRHLNIASIPTFIVILLYAIVYVIGEKRDKICFYLTRLFDENYLKDIIVLAIENNATLCSILPGIAIKKDFFLIRNFIQHNIITLTEVPWTIIFIIVIAFINIYNILLIIPTIFVILFIAFYYSKFNNKKNDSINSKDIKRFSTLEDIFSGYHILKTKIKNDTIDNIIKKQIQYIDDQFILLLQKNQMFYVIKFIKSISQIFNVLIAVLACMNGRIEIQEIFALSILINKTFNNFENLSYFIINYRKIKSSYIRLNKEIVNKIYNEKKNITEKKYSYKENTEIDDQNILIKASNLSFCYPQTQNQIFRNLSFEIKKNSIFTISGPNNSGKSTLIKIISEILKNKDSFMIQRRKNLTLSYCPQESLFFTETVEQIIMSNSQIINKTKLFNITEALGIHQIIIQMPNQYKTIISDNLQFSTAIRNLISIASTLYQYSELYILDDIFANLDDTYIQKIIKLIIKMKENGHSFVIVTKNQSIIEISDQKLIL